MLGENQTPFKQAGEEEKVNQILIEQEMDEVIPDLTDDTRVWKCIRIGKYCNSQPVATVWSDDPINRDGSIYEG